MTGRPLALVLHAHSRWSYDGSWSLPGLAQLFGAFGVDAVLMTEHDTGFDPARFPEYRAACAAASTARCRLVPGIEYSSPDNDIHILTWGLDRFLAEHRPVEETLARVAEAGGAAVFAHPVRRDAWRRYDPAWTPFLSGIEVWNRKADGLACGTRALELVAATGLPPMVGCDFHRLKQLWPLTHRVEIAAGAELEPGILAALRAGQAVPCAFGRPLFGPDGRLLPGALRAQARAEGLRRRLRPLWRAAGGAKGRAKGRTEGRTEGPAGTGSPDPG